MFSWSDFAASIKYLWQRKKLFFFCRFQTATETSKKRFFGAVGAFGFSWEFYRPNYINHVLTMNNSFHCVRRNVTVKVPAPTSRTLQKMTKQDLLLRDQFWYEIDVIIVSRVENMLAIRMKMFIRFSWAIVVSCKKIRWSHIIIFPSLDETPKHNRTTRICERLRKGIMMGRVERDLERSTKGHHASSLFGLCPVMRINVTELMWCEEMSRLLWRKSSEEKSFSMLFICEDKQALDSL